MGVSTYICAPLDCEDLRIRDQGVVEHLASIATNTMGLILGVHDLKRKMLFFNHSGAVNHSALSIFETNVIYKRAQ